MTEEQKYDSDDRRGYQQWTRSLPEGRFRQVVSKLFTNEDHVQFHKVMGLLSVVSFIYRYFWVYPTTGTLGFDGKWIDHATMGAHLLLSSSSLIFHVIRFRIKNRPMIIWEEYRLHAIIFSVRCLSVYLFGFFFPPTGALWERIALPTAVLLHHVVVDRVTDVYGSKDGSTTVRIKDDNKPDVTAVLRFYSFYQFAALASYLQPHARLSDLGFNALIAIQSSAFLMTLYRKSLISERTHALVYTACLVISMFHIFRNCSGDAFFFAKLSAAYLARTNFRLNKYFLWVCFVVVSVPAVERYIVHTVTDFFRNHGNLVSEF
jgi:hypothetical protein